MIIELEALQLFEALSSLGVPFVAFGIIDWVKDKVFGKSKKTKFPPYTKEARERLNEYAENTGYLTPQNYDQHFQDLGSWLQGSPSEKMIMHRLGERDKGYPWRSRPRPRPQPQAQQQQPTNKPSTGIGSPGWLAQVQAGQQEDEGWNNPMDNFTSSRVNQAPTLRKDARPGGGYGNINMPGMEKIGLPAQTPRRRGRGGGLTGLGGRRRQF